MKFNKWNWVAILLALIVVVMIGAGCGGLVPTKRTGQDAATTTAQTAVRQQEMVEKVVEGSPQVAMTSGPVTVSGTNNQVNVTVDPTPAPAAGAAATAPGTNRAYTGYRVTTRVKGGVETEAKEAEKLTSAYAVTLPWGVSLILIAIGLGLIGGIIWWARRSSAAANEAWNYADNMLAGMIREKRNRAIASIDPREIASLQTDVAHLEAERGRMAKD